MTRDQFKKLKVGDICVIIKGRDEGRRCQVAYIEGDAVLVRSDDGRRFDSMTKYARLRLTSWRELTPITKEES
jgi:hypothetical protein